MKDYVEEVSKKVVEHRRKVVVTCAEDCWCWDIDALLTIIEVLKSDAPQQSSGVDRGIPCEICVVHGLKWDGERRRPGE